MVSMSRTREGYIPDNPRVQLTFAITARFIRLQSHLVLVATSPTPAEAGGSWFAQP